jgi:hypothetical protein
MLVIQLLRRHRLENCGLRLAPGKKSENLSEKQTKSKKTGDVAQVVVKGPAFKFLYHQANKQKPTPGPLFTVSKCT